MERLVKLSMIYVLVVLFCVDQGRAYEVPQFIQKLLADASKTSSSASKTPVKNTSCDYIIVGAGSAGCVIANRLSANPDNTVCLLESGGLESEIHQMPVLTIALQSTPSNYGYTTVPQNHSCLSMNNNSCGIPQGKSLGGSSSINYSIYNRGNIEGYDKWAAAGNEGWSYKDVLKYFKRAENSSLSKYPESPYHNSSGSYRSTEDVKYRTKIGDAFIRSCKESGLKYIDYNAPHNDEGCSYTQASTLNGRRHSSYSAYIDPILEDRANLHVLPYSLVTKILIDSDTKTAYGVNFEHLGEKFTIMASKEVILSAGTFHSAQLLMVSGVGPKDVLDNIGVPVVINLPVGKTYQDHSSAIIPLFTVNTTLQTLYIDRVTPIDIVEFEAGDASTIVSSISAIEASAFFRDFELTMGGKRIFEMFWWGIAHKRLGNTGLDVYNKYYKQLEEVELFGFLTKANYPESKGSVWVDSKDVKVPPKINPNYLSSPKDVETILKGAKKAIEIIKSPAMQAINATLITTKVPGCEDFKFGIDDYWRCAIRHFTFNLHHHIGTCEMGPASDKTSVVDSYLRVHGVEGLRVADASVIPVMLSAHMDAPATMIGEKAADMILDGNRNV